MKVIRRIGAALAAALVIAGVLMPAVRTEAASADIELSKDLETVRVDDVVEVTLTLSAEIVPGTLKCSIRYPDDVLEFVSLKDSPVHGGEGYLTLNDEDPQAHTNVRKYVMLFRAVGLGTAEIKLGGAPEVYEDEMEYTMSVSYNTLTFDVLPSLRASSDSSLAALKVSPGTLAPEFDPNVFEYSTTVPYETTMLLVSAAANDSGASVKIEGNTDLNVGQNRVLLLVTAEDGTVSKYVIYTAREAENADAPGGGDTGSPEGGDAPGTAAGGGSSGEGIYFYATDEDGEVILNAGSRYTICTDTGSVAIPEGYFRTSILISGHTVTAYSPTEDLSSDYLLLILSKNGGEPGLYSFDRVEKTVQRYSSARKDSVAGSTSSGYSTIEESELAAGYEKSLSGLTLVIAVLSGVCMLLLLITVKLALNARELKKKKHSGSRRTGTRSGS